MRHGLTFTGLLAFAIAHATIIPEIPDAYPNPTAETDRRGTADQPIIISKPLTETRLENDRETRKSRIEFWTAVGTGALAVITAALAIFTYRLWRSTGNLVEDAERTAVRQLRADVFVENARIVAADANSNFIEPNRTIFAGGGTGVVIEFRNFGQTPAYDAQATISTELVDWPLITELVPKARFDDPKISKASMGPSSNRAIFWVSGVVLSTEVLGDLRSGKKAIFVFGEIRYRDAFGNDRFTRYRFYTGGPLGVMGPSLAAHTDGNEADEEFRRPAGSA